MSAKLMISNLSHQRFIYPFHNPRSNINKSGIDLYQVQKPDVLTTGFSNVQPDSFSIFLAIN